MDAVKYVKNSIPADCREMGERPPRQDPPERVLEDVS